MPFFVAFVSQRICYGFCSCIVCLPLILWEIAQTEILPEKLRKKKTMTIAKIASQKTWYTYGHGPLEVGS